MDLKNLNESKIPNFMQIITSKLYKTHIRGFTFNNLDNLLVISFSKFLHATRTQLQVYHNQ